MFEFYSVEYFVGSPESFLEKLGLIILGSFLGSLISFLGAFYLAEKSFKKGKKLDDEKRSKQLKNQFKVLVSLLESLQSVYTKQIEEDESFFEKIKTEYAIGWKPDIQRHAERISDFGAAEIREILKEMKLEGQWEDVLRKTDFYFDYKKQREKFFFNFIDSKLRIEQTVYESVTVLKDEILRCKIKGNQSDLEPDFLSVVKEYHIEMEKEKNNPKKAAQELQEKIKALFKTEDQISAFYSIFQKRNDLERNLKTHENYLEAKKNEFEKGYLKGLKETQVNLAELIKNLSEFKK